MAHKSHRQKVLQAQLEIEPPSISIISPSNRAPLPKPTPANDSMEVEDDDDVLISSGPVASTSASISTDQPVASSSSGFAPLPASAQDGVLKNEFRRVPIPPHRMSPLKREWVNLYTPMVEMLGLQVRMNVKRRAVELKVSDETRIITGIWG